VAVRTRILRVEIEGDEAQRDGREQRVVPLVERPAPVVLEGLALVEVLEGVALRDERERGEVGVRHGVGVRSTN